MASLQEQIEMEASCAKYKEEHPEKADEVDAWLADPYAGVKASYEACVTTEDKVRWQQENEGFTCPYGSAHFG